MLIFDNYEFEYGVRNKDFLSSYCREKIVLKFGKFLCFIVSELCRIL